jgi:hypothetical protein
MNDLVGGIFEVPENYVIYFGSNEYHGDFGLIIEKVDC